MPLNLDTKLDISDNMTFLKLLQWVASVNLKRHVGSAQWFNLKTAELHLSKALD